MRGNPVEFRSGFTSVPFDNFGFWLGGGSVPAAGSHVRYQRTGRAARLPFPVHPHMLRHATGYKLANDGHDTRSLAHYLGHGSLQSTARYTALAPDRFKGFWKD